MGALLAGAAGLSLARSHSRRAPLALTAVLLLPVLFVHQHAEFVAQLMQPWMPWRYFWVFFAAAALASGGIGLVVPRTARLAALLTSLMIFSWFWLVHLSRMLIAPAGPVGWSEMAESLAFAALAFVLAARAGGTQSAVRTSTDSTGSPGAER